MTEASFDEGTEAVEAVLSASRALVAVAARSLVEAEQKVTITQFRAIVTVAHHKLCSLNALAGSLGVTAPTASRMTDRLCAKGLVRRDSDPEDGRQIRVELTERGQSLFEVVMAKRRAEIGRILMTVSDQEQRLIADSLGRFAAAAGESHGVLASYWEL